MTHAQLNYIMLCIACFILGLVAGKQIFQQDEMPVQKMPPEKATAIILAHDACMKYLDNGFCFMTFENYVYYYEAVAVIGNGNGAD